MEQSVVLIKPDGLQRGLIGEIIHRFERKGLHLTAIKMMELDDKTLESWYVHHKDKPFFGNLKSYMKSYPIVAMVWEGIEATKTIRNLLGITKGREAAPGTIRGDFAMSQQFNLVHASENVENAEKEKALIFKDSEIFAWKKLIHAQIYSEEELE